MKQDRWDETDDAALRQLESGMAGELRDMREAATVYTERVWARHASILPVRRTRRMPWVLSTAAVVVLLAGGVRLAHHAAPATPNQAGTGTAVMRQSDAIVSDEALLEQIQGDLSTGVPTAMQPLEASNTRITHASVRSE